MYVVNGNTIEPAIDSSPYGSAVDDFSDPAIVDALNTNASAGVTWAEGVAGHPVFERQEELALADYSAVDAMADAIEDALTALERLADYGAVDAAVAKAEGVDRSLYTEGTLAELDAAVAAVERGYGETRQAEVDAMAEAIEDALAALEEVPAPEPKPEQGADDEGTLPATGDPTALLAPALGLVGVAALGPRRWGAKPPQRHDFAGGPGVFRGPSSRFVRDYVHNLRARPRAT